MEFKIDKHIPAPAYDGLGRACKYPWDKMEIGDSVLVPHAGAQRSAYGYGKRHSMKFRTRKDEGGFRVWRIS